MKLYPYSRIKTENLWSFLLLTRALGVLGYVLIIVSIGLLISSSYMGPETIVRDLGGRMTSTITTPDYTQAYLLGSIWSFVSAIFLLVLSGLLAVVISCECKYTRAG